VEIEIFFLERWYIFLVSFARMAAMVGSLPIFTSSRAAIRMRLGLAVAISLLMFPVLDLSLSEQQTTPVGFGLIIIQEAFLGLLLGFVVQLIFFAVQFGATIVGYQMGFSAAEILDPQNQQQVPLLSQFQNIIAILFFLVLNVHHTLLRVMVDSYKLLPPGTLDFSGNAIPFVLNMTGEMFVLGFKLVTPVLVVLILSMFILGIMSRVFSQLQVFMLSFPINISLALIIIGLSMGMMLSILESEFQNLQEYLLHVLQLL
jgi:flagellar biosynthesis protein FliR